MKGLRRWHNVIRPPPPHSNPFCFSAQHLHIALLPTPSPSRHEPTPAPAHHHAHAQNRQRDVTHNKQKAKRGTHVFRGLLSVTRKPRSRRKRKCLRGGEQH
ncbi:unnamed protein product [Lota lota]